MSGWEEQDLRAVLEDAYELAFIGGETLERAAARIPLANSAEHLEHVLYQHGRHDIMRQFSRNADRVRIAQGVIRR